MLDWGTDSFTSKATIDFGCVHFTSVMNENSTDYFDCVRQKVQLKTLIRLLALPPIPYQNYLELFTSA